MIAEGAALVLKAKGESASIDELLTEVIEYIPLDHSIDSICNTLTHETAHAIDAIASGEFREFVEIFAEALQCPRIAAANKRQFDQLVDRKQKQDAAPPPDLESHGLRFVRILSHLDYRLRVAGVCMSQPLNAEFYGYRPFHGIRATLGDELAACKRKSFAEILAMPAPEAFAACAL